MPIALVVELILAGVEQLPKLIAAIEASREHTAEEKAKLLASIRGRLDATSLRVAAVEIRDV